MSTRRLPMLTPASAGWALAASGVAGETTFAVSRRSILAAQFAIRLDTSLVLLRASRPPVSMVVALLANPANELFTFLRAYCDTASKAGSVSENSMPSDVPFEAVTLAEPQKATRRLPIGVGLSIGACASVALWGAIGLGLKALFF